MDQTTMVIKNLEDSQEKRIDYRNRIWLSNYVEKLRIAFNKEDAFADYSRVNKEWSKDGNFVIQRGERVTFRPEFNPKEEALLLVKDGEIYHIFLYPAKE